MLTNQVDVVFAHATVKPARESAIAIDSLPINFYDGTGIMLLASSGVKELSKVITYENLEKLFAALNSGRYNVMSTDKSALAAWAGNSQNSRTT